MSISLAHAQSIPVDRCGGSAAPAAAAPALAADRFTNWLERLAQWAERQPQHRRLGSYLLPLAAPPKR